MEAKNSPTQNLSAKGLVWLEPISDEDQISSFARATGLDPVLATFLCQRGVRADEVEAFLNPTLKEFCPDPSSFKDMDIATREIGQALLDGRHVTVLADYDVDGATSAAQLNRYFRHFGRELGLYVPDRIKEGYGPSPEAFQALKDEGVDLVITVDCGAAAIGALARADHIDLPVIVLDHHLMSAAEIPACKALVNPNRPDCPSGQGHLAAAGVVFVLLVSLNRYFRAEHGKTASDLPDLRNYLDLCALGTLCDLAPLKGVNRAFVVQGLKIVERDQSAGMLALAQISGRSPPRRVTDLTFGIGPQLNAGGRIGDPWLATRLMSAESVEEALPVAEQLHILNEARKSVEADILDAARRQIEIMLEKKPERKILIAAGEGWHPGVVGIVAGRLKDEFHRPTLIIGYGDQFGELAKGSARSVPGINIGDAIAAAAREGVLVSGGGHAMAGGLSMQIELLDALNTFFDGYCREDQSAIDAAREIQISQNILGSALNLSLLDVIEQAGPYGAGAPKPLFRIREAFVDMSRLVGANHLKLTLRDGNAQIDAIAWRSADRPMGQMLQRGARVDVLGYVERNSWRGKDAVQFEIFDVREIM